MRRVRLILASLLVLLVAASAVAQNADKNSGGPTKNDYRLRIVQPVEGARITRGTIQVVVDRTIPAEKDVAADVNSMPRPLIDVFLDEKFQSSMPSDANVVDLNRVAPGPHTITILAKSMSGEVIDRKVVGIVAVEPPVAKAAMERVEKPRAAEPAPAAVSPAPVETQALVEPPPAAQKLPRTATSDPLLLAAGLLLALFGMVVRRIG